MSRTAEQIEAFRKHQQEELQIRKRRFEGESQELERRQREEQKNMKQIHREEKQSIQRRQWEDIQELLGYPSATMVLEGDILERIFKFVGPGTYRFVGAVNRGFCRSYKKMFKSTNTSSKIVVSSVACVSTWHIEDNDYQSSAYKVCRDAAKLGNLDVLQWLNEKGHSRLFEGT